MFGPKIPSYYYDLGDIAPTWHTPEFNRSLTVRASFKVFQDNDDTPVLDDAFILYTGRNVYDTSSDRLSTDEKDLVIHNLGTAVLQIDPLYREYKGLPREVTTSHTVMYRTGLARLDGPPHHQSLGSYLPFSGPGRAHTDSSVLSEDMDNVVISHGGRPTQIFVGTMNETAAFFLGKLGRLGALLVNTSQDRATVINRYTIHRQAAQVYSPRSPGAFFSSIIEVVESDKPAEPLQQ